MTRTNLITCGPSENTNLYRFSTSTIEWLYLKNSRHGGLERISNGLMKLEI